VQGVGFRWFVVQKAHALGLRGHVRNLPDGRVEVVAAGAARSILELERLVATGPRLAAVDHVEKQDVKLELVMDKSFIVK
jgi:acylphosphatase